MRDRIHCACERSGRQPSSVRLIAVTKGVGADAVREAVTAGAIDLGENRVQEAVAKQDTLASLPARWHLIGHLQRNKAAHAARRFAMVQSVDSLEIAQALNRFREGVGTPLDILLQVNVTGEASKSGCRPDEVAALAAALAALPRVRLRGLMTIGPLGAPEAARPAFRALRAVREALHRGGSTGLQLSMGMSQDFEIAIEEGADMIRVGTAIFGDRDG